VSCKGVKQKLFSKSNFYSLPSEYDVSVRIRAEPLVKDKMVYWDAKEFHLHIDTLKLFQVNFENIFNGDKELGKLRQM
jgi:hypothetical protein